MVKIPDNDLAYGQAPESAHEDTSLKVLAFIRDRGAENRPMTSVDIAKHLSPDAVPFGSITATLAVLIKRQPHLHRRKVPSPNSSRWIYGYWINPNIKNPLFERKRVTLPKPSRNAPASSLGVTRQQFAEAVSIVNRFKADLDTALELSIIDGRLRAVMMQEFE